MAKQQISLKQLSIDKDNTAIVIAVGLASFIVIFSLVASNALLKQRAYQSRVITQKKAALKQLKTNVSEIEKLKTSYQTFAEEQQNILEGSATGQGSKDGDNPRIILDALPSKYDFPALATSMEKVFKPYNLESLTGTDDELGQATAAASATPQPVEIPFAVTMNGSAQTSKEILQLFEKSIRPMQIQRLTLNGQANQLKISVDGKTYFQPQKKFDVKTEKVQ